VIRFENTAGFEAEWDLNKLLLSAGYDHDTFNALTSRYQYSDNTSELFNAKAAFLVSSINKLGLEIGGGLTTYDQNVLDNSTHFSVGPFYQAQFTPHLGASASVGFASYEFAHNGTVTNVSDFNGYYAALSLNHIVNDGFSHSLSAGRRIQLGITANLSEIYYARYQATWNFIRNVFTTFAFEYDHGNTSGGVVETYDRYGPTVGLGYQITERLASTVTYSFWQKESDVSTLSYTQNRLLIDFTYAF
jgi:hypothetical protein